MSDVNEWLKERRTIHDAAPRGAWETSSAERDAFYNLPALLTVVENVLELHTRIVTDRHVAGPTAVCEQCSEDRMFALWPCETVEAIERAING